MYYCNYCNTTFAETDIVRFYESECGSAAIL